METLWSTLHSITTIKRRELAKQRDACKALRQELLNPLQQEEDPKARVRLLLKRAGQRDGEGLIRHRKQRTAQVAPLKESSQHDEILALAGISALNIQRFLQQSEVDASISSAYFSSIEADFQRALRALEIKYDYATLFSDLVTERSKEHLEAINASAISAEGYESIGREEMLEQRKEWESIAFEPSTIERANVYAALQSTFHSPEALQALDILRKQIDRVCYRIQHNKVRGIVEMKMLVNGLIASDLLADEQTSVLKQARNSDTWLSEMADVINLRLASIEKWSWETEAVQLEMRRQLNGKHRVYMLEEISQALLIYHIGIHFAVGFARAFDEFYHGSGWKKHTGVGRSDQAQWDYFVGKRSGGRPGARSIRNELFTVFHRDFFMSVLPRKVSEGAGGYGDDSLTDEQMQSRVAKSVNSKHSLLHLLIAESLMADRLEEELYVVQTDFHWFGPSLSHNTIDAVMEFFGVSKLWRDFFDEFLQAPLQFKMDGPQGQIRRRQKGVPMSHVLSSLFGEAALFCVDYAVNEATKGKPMFRLHDDIYLWGSSEEMQSAWKALTTLTSTMGISLNLDKTGSARLTKNAENQGKAYPKTLPIGPLQWGLLSTSASAGLLSVNQESIDGHIIELKRQLESRKSILAWIRAYNTYMDFFKLHLGRTANAMGRVHIDECLTTIHRINKELCPSTNGDVAAYIEIMIASKFGIKHIPHGFLYFPMICGGLELRNPTISLQAMRDNVLQDPLEILEEALEREVVEYNRLKDAFDKDGPTDKHALPNRPDTFMSYDQYKVYRREYSLPLYQAWTELQLPILEENVETTLEMDSLLAKLPKNGDQDHAFVTSTKQTYWRSVVELYGPEMGKTFGGLQVVEKDLLPMGMVDLLRSKVRWDA